MKNQIALRTGLIILGLFVVGFIAILLSNRRKEYTERKVLWRRYVAWYIITPFILVPSYFGNLSFALALLAFIELCLFEFFRMMRIVEDRFYSWPGFLLGSISVLTASIGGYNFAPIIIVMTLVLIPLMKKEYQDATRKVSITGIGVFYCGWLFSLLIFVQKGLGFGYIVLLCGMVALNDILAYTFGKTLGHAKIFPTISPGKTWWGGFGGVVGSISGGMLFSFATPDLKILHILVLGALVGVAGQLGDVVISVFKRDMGVKDTGHLIPGHGGLLDRCDSLIYSTPVFLFYLKLVA